MFPKPIKTPLSLKPPGMSPMAMRNLLVCLTFISCVAYSPRASASRIPNLAEAWDILYDGEGFVSFDAQNGIILQPFASTSPSESHATLALATWTETSPLKDFQIIIRASTEQQLRLPTPNGWEVFTLFFNYEVDQSEGSEGKKTNYLKLTDQGVELGTLADKTGQTFLATNKRRTLSLGEINTYLLTKKGNHIEVSIDGERVVNFMGLQQLYDLPGAIGVYTEDARAHIYSVDILPIDQVN